MDQKNPRILVVGAGAIGGFYGGLLAQAGASVSFVCRSNYASVKSKGFLIRSCWGDFEFRPDQVVRDAKDYTETADIILVALKVLPELNVASLIRPALSKNTAIVLLQNGVEIEHDVFASFPNNELISGLAFVCVNRVSHCEINHLDFGRLSLGVYPDGISECCRLLKSLFSKTGVPCEISENIVYDRWKKLLWNAAFNPISVLGDHATTKTIIDNPKATKIVYEIMSEVVKIANACGHNITLRDVNKNIEDTRKMKAYKTSMLLDFEAGKKMEVEAILGKPIAIAEQNNIPVPNLKCIYALMSLLGSPATETRS